MNLFSKKCPCALVLLGLLWVPAAAQPITELKPVQRQHDMSVFVNQAGFRPGAVKSCTAPGSAPLAFQVIDATTNRVAYHGTMEPGGPDFGAYVTGNFSSLATPGVYYIKAGQARSFPFRIAVDVYEEPMGLILHYFSKQRCGNSTTGYMTPCHTEDGLRVDNGRRQDVSGGWHDASDLRKWVSATIYGMVGILRMAETLGEASHTPAVTEELLWGNRYFLHMQEPAGYIMDHVGGDLYKHSDSNHWTDNVMGTDDDRVIQTRPVDNASQYTFVTVEAMMARYMQGKDAAYARECLDAAVRGYDWCRANMTGKEYDAGVTGSALLAALELHKATGERKYKDFAYEMAGRIVSLQVDPARDSLSPGGFFRLTPGGDTYYSEIARCDFAFTGLCELVSAFPDEDTGKYTQAIRRYCDEYLAFLADKNAFGLLPYAVYGTPDAAVRRAGCYGYRYFMNPSLDWWVGINANIAGKGVALIRASRLLNDPGLSARAQRQLDWIFGANPLGTCTMRGVGYEHPAFADAFYKDAERPGSEFFPPTPHIPGAVLNGIGGDADDMPQMIPGGWQTGEYWTPMVGLTLWLMAELTVLP